MGSMAQPEIPYPWLATPLVKSAALSRAAGCQIYLKLENLQPSGSFKSRGIGNLVRQALLDSADPARTHFYASSGGNAGLACVTAAQMLGRPATVVVPLSTKPLMIAKIKTAGAAEVLQYGESWREADNYLKDVVMKGKQDAVYVPPFDHPDVWYGNSTITDELEKKPDAIVCSVGGGGLFCGIQMGLARRGWSDVDILAIETEGAESFHASISSGSLVELDNITSIATSLGCKKIAERAFELGLQKNVRNVVLSDAEAAMGCWRLADDERMLVEPACGVSVSVCYDGRLKKLLPNLTAESEVVIVLCGGSNVTLELLMQYREEYGYIEKSITKCQPLASNLTAPM